MTAFRWVVPSAVLACSLGCATAKGRIGAVFAQSHIDGTVRVREAPAHLAAAQAGLQRDDELLLVDGRDVRVLSPEALHDLLSGSVGSIVHLTVLRSGTIRRIEVPRAAIAAD